MCHQEAKTPAPAPESAWSVLIARSDARRLARNLAFIAALLEKHVPFVACDLPEANEFMLHVMAAVA